MNYELLLLQKYQGRQIIGVIIRNKFHFSTLEVHHSIRSLSFILFKKLYQIVAWLLGPLLVLLYACRFRDFWMKSKYAVLLDYLTFCLVNNLFILVTIFVFCCSIMFSISSFIQFWFLVLASFNRHQWYVKPPSQICDSLIRGTWKPGLNQLIVKNRTKHCSPSASDNRHMSLVNTRAFRRICLVLLIADCVCLHCSYIFPLFYKGYKRGLTEDDIYPHLSSHDSKILGEKLEKQWNKELKRSKNPSLWRAFAKVFGREMMTYGLGILLFELLRF